MFFGPGEIKAVLTGFKTTKTGIAFQRVIKTTLDTFFELIDKYFKPTNLSPDIHKNSIIDFETIDKAVKKTEQYIKVNAYKAGKKIDKLIGNNQPATTNKINTIKKLPSGAELIKENNSISLNTGYIQNEKAVKHNFTTYGNRLSGKGYKRFKYKLTEMKVEEKYIKEMYRSSSNRPNIRVVKEGMELYKIVPKNSIVHDRTPYWITKTELIKIFNNERGIEDMLALPEGSCKGIYDIYKITLKNDQDIKNIRIFESKIAPSSQGEIKRYGGVKQILVLNRKQWTDAVKIEELKIE